MVIPDILFSLFVALVISIFFSWIFKKKGPRKGFGWFFLVVFLAVLAGGLWAKPTGASFVDNNWLPFLLSGIFTATILTLIAPRYPKVDRDKQLTRNETMEILDEIDREKKVAALAYISLNVFFWLIIAILVILITIRYLF